MPLPSCPVHNSFLNHLSFDDACGFSWVDITRWWHDFLKSLSVAGDQSRGTPSASPPLGGVSGRRRKTNVHVHITTPSPTNVPEAPSEEICARRVRTRRAGSMDKHLLRMGSAYGKRNRSATMTLAIKAIGDSLVTPLDLNISPPMMTDFDIEYGKSKKNVFKFPSMKKKSKSQGHLAGLGQSFEESMGIGVDLHNSARSPSKSPLNDIRELEKELINLPTYEVDPRRLNLSTSPLLSRSNSVPDHLSAVSTPVPKSPSHCPFPDMAHSHLANHTFLSSPNDSQEQIIVTNGALTHQLTNQTYLSSPNDSQEHILSANQSGYNYMTSEESLQGHTNQVCPISVSPYHQNSITETNNNHPVLCLPSDSLGERKRSALQTEQSCWERN